MVIFLEIGLLGALLMFAGDMFLYYDKNDCQADGTFQPIINIMKKESRTRLYIGGLLGLIAAFLYCVGYYHTVLFVVEVQHRIIGWICFLVNSLGIICGGAYHSHCANLGLLGKFENDDVMDEVLKYLSVQNKIAFTISGIGFVMQAGLIVLGMTILPRWMFFTSPLFLVLLTPLVKKLPKGLHMVICGGWTNLISIIYYAVAIIIMG